MKAKSFTSVFVIVAICLFVVFACSKGNNNNKTINDLIGHFTASGLKVGNLNEKFVDMISAESGTGLDINGIEIEVYKFDMNKAASINRLNSIKQSGQLEVAGFKVPVLVKDSFILCGHTNHPLKEVIIKSFMSF